jgi:hypothetical protein
MVQQELLLRPRRHKDGKQAGRATQAIMGARELPCQALQSVVISTESDSVPATFEPGLSFA